MTERLTCLWKIQIPGSVVFHNSREHNCLETLSTQQLEWTFYKGKSDHIPSLITISQWLPISLRVKPNLLAITRRALSDLPDLCHSFSYHFSLILSFISILSCPRGSYINYFLCLEHSSLTLLWLVSSHSGLSLDVIHPS